MVNYKNSKIYKVISDAVIDIYVGSTTKKLCQRIAKHRSSSRENPDRKFYKFVAGNGGWDCFRIVLIENYPCNNKDELLAREEYWRKELNATLNSMNAKGKNKEKIKEAVRKYQHSQKGIEARKRARERFYATEKGKEILDNFQK